MVRLASSKRCCAASKVSDGQCDIKTDRRIVALCRKNSGLFKHFCSFSRLTLLNECSTSKDDSSFDFIIGHFLLAKLVIADRSVAMSTDPVCANETSASLTWSTSVSALAPMS